MFPDFATKIDKVAGSFRFTGMHGRPTRPRTTTVASEVNGSSSQTWVSLRSADRVSRREILRRRRHGEVYEWLAACIGNAVDRARGRAHDVAGAQPVGLAVIHQKQSASLLNEPYLFANRVHMSWRRSARLHRDACDRDPGFWRIVGPHDLHRSDAEIPQGREVCRRGTLNGQDHCRPFQLHQRPEAAENADRRDDRRPVCTRPIEGQMRAPPNDLPAATTRPIGRWGKA
jgi:hypothetical protein